MKSSTPFLIDNPMKYILISIIAGALIALAVSIFDFEIEKWCGNYQASNYTENIGQRGYSCSFSLEVFRVKESYPVRFEDEWTIE